MNHIIEVAGVTKAFGRQTVLRDIHFKVKPGEILGLLGPEWSWKNNFSSNLEWSHKT